MVIFFLVDFVALLFVSPDIHLFIQPTSSYEVPTVGHTLLKDKDT